jgi:hypothetical protein
MRKISLSIFFCATLLVLSTTSCQKDEIKNIAVDQELLTANSMADFSNESDFNYSVETAATYESYSARVIESALPPTCASITIDNSVPGSFPKTITIDYGIGCTYNGISRSGIVTVTLSNYVTTFGSTLTIQRGANYYINGRKLEGTIVYQNITTDTAIPKWNRTITNGKLITQLGVEYTYSGTRVVQQTAGLNTLTLGDNVYEILSGNHTIQKTANGNTLTLNVVQKLIKKYACNYISQGQLNIQGSFLDGIVDYGDNTCDNQATYTHSNGTVYNINL